MSFDDEQIKRVIKATREAKVDKVWKDPVKAEKLGLLFLVCFAYTVIILGFILAFPDTFISSTSDKWQEFKDIALSNMDCDGLKQTLLDINKSDKTYQNIPDEITRQIIGKCLP